MAEYVHQTLEEMVPELEQMNHLGLFTPKETEVILKKRESFEYRLRQITKTKASYLNYIEYEKKLLELLKIRRQKIAGDAREREVEKSISDRIHQLYRLLITRFQDDIDLWQQHIDFSKAMNEKAFVTRLYERALKLHSHKEDIWIDAALWECATDGNGDHEQARTVLLKAHRVNPESHAIFLELFHMELELARLILKRKAALILNKVEDQMETEDDTDEGALKLAGIVYKKGIELFPGLSEFHMKILNIALEFTEAEALQKTIIADLKEKYPSSPSVWNCLALRHLLPLKKKSSGAQKRTCVAKCLEVYNTAVQEVPTGEMWALCLRSHINLLSVKEVPEKPELLQSTLRMFQKAASSVRLPADLYSELLSLLDDLCLTEDVALVAEAAVSQHPSCTKLWLTKLRFMAAHNEEAQAMQKALRIALKNVPPEECWPLWEFVLNTLAFQNSDCLEGLMERACRCGSPGVSKPAKEWCLHWTFRQGGIKSARTAYARLKTMRPISLDFYRLYIQAECAQETPNLKVIRLSFEDALVEFGRDEPDLWLNYMEMEREVGKDAARSGLTQQRALSTLSQHLKELFVRKQFVSVNDE